MKFKSLALGLISASAVLFTTVVNAATPTSIQYQGKLTDADGLPVDDGEYTMSFAIGTEDAATVIYGPEEMSVTTDSGFYSVVLQDVDAEALATDEFYLHLTVGEDAFAPVRLLAVPYALHAATASSVVGELGVAIQDVRSFQQNSLPKFESDFTTFGLIEGDEIDYDLRQLFPDSTGDITAEGLPEGVEIDENGNLVGEPTVPGTYAVTLSTSNNAGTTSREIVISVGSFEFTSSITFEGQEEDEALEVNPGESASLIVELNEETSLVPNQYVWSGPNGAEIITSEPVLTLDEVTNEQQGFWSVVADFGFSQVAADGFVFIDVLRTFGISFTANTFNPTAGSSLEFTVTTQLFEDTLGLPFNFSIVFKGDDRFSDEGEEIATGTITGISGEATHVIDVVTQSTEGWYELTVATDFDSVRTFRYVAVQTNLRSNRSVFDLEGNTSSEAEAGDDLTLSTTHRFVAEEQEGVTVNYQWQFRTYDEEAMEWSDWSDLGAAAVNKTNYKIDTVTAANEGQYRVVFTSFLGDLELASAESQVYELTVVSSALLLSVGNNNFLNYGEELNVNLGDTIEISTYVVFTNLGDNQVVVDDDGKITSRPAVGPAVTVNFYNGSSVISNNDFQGTARISGSWLNNQYYNSVTGAIVNAPAESANIQGLAHRIYKATLKVDPVTAAIHLANIGVQVDVSGLGLSDDVDDKAIQIIVQQFDESSEAWLPLSR